MKPEIKIYDLTRTVPSGVELSGLSTPRFDGVNYFRQPTGASRIEFSVSRPSFVQLEYQLYSSEAAVTGQTSLDGVPLARSTFPAGKFIANSMLGEFIEAGTHQFEISYSCVPTCTEPFNQYWTKLHVIDASQQKATEDAGLGVMHWNQYAPASPLQLTGTNSLEFDGVNFWRLIQVGGFHLKWPAETKILNASFLINGNQNFKVVTKLGREVLATERGTAKQGVYTRLGLVGKSTERGLTVEVKCLETPRMPCTTLYFPQISVQTPPPLWQASLPGATIGAFTLCVLAWWGLGLSPVRLRRSV